MNAESAPNPMADPHSAAAEAGSTQPAAEQPTTKQPHAEHRADEPPVAQPGCGPDCGQVLEQLEAYLMHQLPEPLSDQLHQHLQACGGCAEELEDFDMRQHLQALLRRCCPCDPAPEQLRQRVSTWLDSCTEGDSETAGGFFHFSFTHTKVTYYESE